MTTNRISYAQNGEDVRVWRALRDVPGQKRYVEVGASHPYDDSTTAALAAEGWHGVLVEPDPDMVRLLREARPQDAVVPVAASDRSGVLSFDAGPDRGLGQVAEATASGLSVPAVRLAEVLDDVLDPQDREVHFMSVDVEGHEAAVLRGADLRTWRPWVLAVEATRPNSRELGHAEWEPVVLDADYRFVAFDGLNRWYVAQEHAEVAEDLAAPFNVLDHLLDGWQRRAEVELDKHLRRAREDGAALAEDRDAAVRASAVAETALRATEARATTAERLAAERLEQVRGLEAELHRVVQEHALVAAARDAALARERVLLGSKSWQLTAPLRTLRWRAGLAVERRRGVPPAVPAGTAAPSSRPGDDRRRQARAQRGGT